MLVKGKKKGELFFVLLVIWDDMLLFYNGRFLDWNFYDLDLMNDVLVFLKLFVGKEEVVMIFMDEDFVFLGGIFVLKEWMVKNI